MHIFIHTLSYEQVRNYINLNLIISHKYNIKQSLMELANDKIKDLWFRK